MTRGPLFVLVLVLVLATATRITRADRDPPVVPRTLSHEPPPRHLHMRPRTAAAEPAEPAPAPTAEPAPSAEGAVVAGDAAGLRDLKQPVSAQVSLGYVVDGTALTGRTTLSGALMLDKQFQTVRAYGFGDGTVSTRGVGMQSLSSYFAAKFQLTRAALAYDPNNATPPPLSTPPPIATWFERSGFEPRAAWAEVSDFLPDHALPLLRVRAGELYVYGPWVLHMYGATAAWEGKVLSGSIYGGSRVPDYTLTDTSAKDRAGIGGATVRVDLAALRDPVPIVIAAQALGFTAAGASQASNHTQVEVTYVPRKDLVVLGEARTLAGDLASEHVQLRSRYQQTTNLVIDLTHRHQADWLWDPSVTQPDSMAPRRYLDLGPELPQLLMSARAGTLVAENVDVYLRGAIASDLTSVTAQRSTYAASYFEVGGALELRLRRTLALGLSALTRQTQRTDTAPITDTGTPDPLPAATSAALGERGFTEIGSSLRMSLGARKFSVQLEIYGRRTNYARDYCVEPECASYAMTGATGIPTADVRGGGRFTIDAWVGKRLRLFATYDLSSALQFAPEITGYKSLRLMMEGVY